ncbi:extensin family protein [Martelella sp. HB161492]|uniref:extensin-like domain-containing protein n=1 Tax=Martelella sp. HB161492 TaxID=2720726 RepID=UPI0015925461|nr:extensin family protein [Martelella sp. HB161492]
MTGKQIVSQACLLITAIFLLSAFALPDDPPIPQRRPAPETVSPPAAAADDAAVTPEDTPPVPDARADNPPEKASETAKSAAPPAEDPQAYAACLAALSALGAIFDEAEPIRDDGGCGIARPIVLKQVARGIAFKPEGPMRCKTALALADWARGFVDPAARAAFGPSVQLTTINQASTYACRSRNSVAGAKISEHAKGNAVDIRSLEFSDGSEVIMKPRKTDSALIGAFQRTTSASACLYFSTVLSPGSDATHQDHMHLDVMPRKGGYRYCR